MKKDFETQYAVVVTKGWFDMGFYICLEARSKAESDAKKTLWSQRTLDCLEMGPEMQLLEETGLNDDTYH